MKPVIVFDFGGVLLDWDPRHLYRQVFNGDEQAMERFLAEVEFYDWNLKQDAGRPFVEGVTAACEEYPSYCDLLRLYDERWSESISGPILESVAILRQLKESGFHLLGLSNWSAEKFQLVRNQYEFFCWFEQIVISGEERLIKPDPLIFHRLLEHTSVPASDCLLIDDSIKNIESAGKLGFQVIHFQNPAQLRSELCTLGLLLKN